MKKIWRHIKGFENYEISNYGDIKNSDGKILSPKTTSKGYKLITLYKRKTYSIHRLVAQTFIDNPENKPEVNHKDNNRTNNNVENLEWVTKNENIQHSYSYGNKIPQEGTLNGKAMLSEQDVQELRSSYIPHSKEFGMKALAKKYGVSEATINRVVHNRSYKNIK